MKWNRGQFIGMTFIVSAPLSIGYRSDLELPSGLVTGLILLCLLVNLVLWSIRNRVSAHAGMQILLWIGGAAAGVILFFSDRAGTLGIFDERFADSPRLQYLVLLVFPINSLIYHFINKGLLTKNVVEQVAASDR